jgi:DNA adenine methylase
MVESVDVSVDEWYRQADVYDSGAGDDTELGFAAFFLNRTNRSGILNARPIGGLNQTGKWLIDARFNREDLANRIRLISRYKNRVTISEQDGAQLLSEMIPDGKSKFFYVDPPYTDKGQDLYLNDLTWEDHRELAGILAGSDARWLVTYNCDRRILRELYPGHRCVRFEIKHTAQHQHIGSEFAIFSSNLVVETLDDLSVGDARFIRAG